MTDNQDENQAAAAQVHAQNVYVQVTTKALKIEKFQPSGSELTMGKEWTDWLDELESEFRYFNITGVADKADGIKIYGGKEVKRLAKNLPDPTVKPEYAAADEQINDYTKIKWKLTDYYRRKTNYHHAKYLFNKMRPEMKKDGKYESTISYAARLREAASYTDFSDKDERILEHLIQTSPETRLIEKAIGKKWDLSRFITEAAQTEALKMQVDDMKHERVEEEKVVAKVGHQKNGKKFFKNKYSGSSSKSQSHDSSNGSYCNYCGKTGKHPPGKNCPAYGKKCTVCGRYNHFQKVCRFKKNDSGNSAGQKKHVKKTEEENGSSEDEFFGQVVHHLHVKRLKDKDILEKTVLVRVEDVDVHAEPDTGSDVNLMDEYQFKALVHRTNTKLELAPSKVKLSTLQSKLPVKGEVQTVIRNQTCGVKAKFVVLKGHSNSPPLLGRDTLEDLGMLKIDPTGQFAEENELKIKSVSESSEYSKMKEKYNEVFTGIGQIRDKRTGQEMYATFTMKDDAVPVAQKARPVAYHLQEPLKKWLETGLREGIFEKIPDGEAITWCSPLVVQPKPRYTSTPRDELEPHMIRASIDLRIPNRYMERNRIAQSPVVEDFTHKFHNCVIFSKLDMNQGYHQLLLAPSSRAVATFSTPWGNMRPRRLVFGAKASQDSFDDVMYRIFGDIPYCLNQRDDILIGGRNKEEHDRTLEKVLQRASDFGVTFSAEKCQFGVEELEFYGYKFTKNGLQPTAEKVRAVKECGRPESKSAVRSFLGMVGYLSKFIPRYSSLTAPLRQLTHNDTKFHWGKQEEAAFIALKDAIYCVENRGKFP